MASDVYTALKFIEDECFAVKNVVLTNKETGEVVSIKKDGHTENINEKVTEKETTERTLYIKDKYNLSNQAYHELPHTTTFMCCIKKSTIIKFCFNY